MKKTNIDLVEMQKSFNRTDKLTAFKKELSELINSHGIDSLLEVPDYILATAAVAQMEICSSMASGVTKGHFKPVLMM